MTLMPSLRHAQQQQTQHQTTTASEPPGANEPASGDVTTTAAAVERGRSGLTSFGPRPAADQQAAAPAATFRRHWHAAAVRRRRQRWAHLQQGMQWRGGGDAPAASASTMAAAREQQAAAAAAAAAPLRALQAAQAAQAAAAAESPRPCYPFTAIIGQEEMKLSLVLNVVDPRIGGVMVFGDRGTGKTTAVRALADLLPRITVVAGDPFNSDPSDPELMGPEAHAAFKAGTPRKTLLARTPLVDLPLGATEDRVCGTIDFERALIEGVRAFEPGLLARANRGILYVDEVNLLDDHLVDVLLDSAASGWNVVERESISIRHPARFVLVGSGNPEEGELRPQLLDRFGMHAFIRTVSEPSLRVAIVNERQAFDDDAEAFRARFEGRQRALAECIVAARKALIGVEIDYDTKLRISKVCSGLNVDGIRGDIVTTRAARALAALEGRARVSDADVGRVIVMGLRHRLRKDPLSSIDTGERVREEFERVFGVAAATIKIG
ncbi:hypothetical protein FOA52_003459 [Chlamydomonas sp. UWO 241]|nr:hypothetical protein FOA52_003459 [Chlamydomonas sp. UWO 241]